MVVEEGGDGRLEEIAEGVREGVLVRVGSRT